MGCSNFSDARATLSPKTKNGPTAHFTFTSRRGGGTAASPTVLDPAPLHHSYAAIVHSVTHVTKSPDDGAFCFSDTGSGGRIWTYDLRVMSPTSCQTAPPRSRGAYLNKPPTDLQANAEDISASFNNKITKATAYSRSSARLK